MYKINPWACKPSWLWVENHRRCQIEFLKYITLFCLNLSVLLKGHCKRVSYYNFKLIKGYFQQVIRGLRAWMLIVSLQIHTRAHTHTHTHTHTHVPAHPLNITVSPATPLQFDMGISFMLDKCMKWGVWSTNTPNDVLSLFLPKTVVFFVLMFSCIVTSYILLTSHNSEIRAQVTQVFR